MWKHDYLLVNKVLDFYDLAVKHLENNVSSVNTGDSEIDADLIRSASLKFCKDWLEFSSSYREVKDKDLDVAIKAISEFNSNVDSAVGAIALQRKMKDKKLRVGEEAPAYKAVDKEALVNAYLSGANISQLMDEFNISRPTVIKRLKESGVYKDSRLK